METQSVRIKSIEPTTSKGGKDYWKVDTNKGMMTCFEEDIVKELKKSLFADVEVKTMTVTNDKGYTNIREFKDVKIDKSEKKTQKEEAREEAKAIKNASVYTSYAKDIFIAFQGKMPIRECAKVIEEAREFFT